MIAFCGAFSLTFGIWAEFWPRSFAALILFPPYNEHLVHDVGALQIGIGVTGLLALLPIDAPMVFLGGFLLGASFHAADHVVDRHLGGHSEDVLGLGLLAVLRPLGWLFTFGGRQLSANPIAETAEAGNEAPERRAHLASVADP
ncbi:MAG TPA: hypothetical protein VI094_11895, partial [Propionibacteriaceae bacterium]